MEIGLVTYTPEKVEGYNYHVYYSKWVNGSVFPASKEMQNDVSCFCDAKAIREKPDIVAISKNGPALNVSDISYAKKAPCPVSDGNSAPRDFVARNVKTKVMFWATPYILDPLTEAG